MPPTKPNLRIVNTETGEQLDECPNCAGAETEVRAWRQRYAVLKRDREAEARGSELWPEALALFRYWQERTGHPAARWSATRFELIAPLLEKYGAERCRKAIRGGAFDPYVTRRKNGEANPHNGFDLIFRSAEKLEEFEARDPERAPRFAQLTLVEHAKQIAGRVLERAKLIEEGDDPVALAHLLIEIDRLTGTWLELPKFDREGRTAMIEGAAQAYEGES